MFVTTTPGLTVQHTIRAHEGDRVSESDNGDVRITYGPREVTVANEKRELPGHRVVISGDHIIEMTTIVRLEPKVRPSVARIVNKEKAEVAELAQKLLAQKTPTLPTNR